MFSPFQSLVYADPRLLDLEAKNETSTGNGNCQVVIISHHLLDPTRAHTHNSITLKPRLLKVQSKQEQEQMLLLLLVFCAHAYQASFVTKQFHKMTNLLTTTRTEQSFACLQTKTSKVAQQKLLYQSMIISFRNLEIKPQWQDSTKSKLHVTQSSCYESRANGLLRALK